MTIDMDFSKWIGDGSDASTLEEVTGDTINIASARSGTPFNVRLESGSSSDLYYEVNVVDLPRGSSLGVGLVSQDKFRPGWKTKGYFYNGNVSNGSAGLIMSFGPRIAPGDTVGVLLRRLDGVAEIVFYHNRRCLGAAFSVKDSSELFPCLHVGGSAKVKVTSGTAPNIITRENASLGDPYSGNWEIKRLFVGPDLGEFPLTDTARFKLTLEKTKEKQYSLMVKVANTFSTAIELGDKLEAFDSIKFLCGCASTRMMPHPELIELEKLIGKELNGGDNESRGLKKMMVSSDGSLLISGPIMEMSFVRHVEIFKPVTSID